MEFKEILGKENYNIEEIKNDMGFKDNKELIKYIFSSFIKNINENEDNSYLFNSFKLLSRLFKDYYFERHILLQVERLHLNSLARLFG